MGGLFFCLVLPLGGRARSLVTNYFASIPRKILSAFDHNSTLPPAPQARLRLSSPLAFSTNNKKPV